MKSPPYSLSLSRSATQSKKTLKSFEANKHKLQSRTKTLQSDTPQIKPLFEDEGIGNAGDFRSKDCLELLKKADIVVTNPPFSLFREYVATLIEYEKKFLIIGNVNAITYKEIFSLIKDDKLWLGISITSGDREFGVPNYYPLEAAGIRIDEKTGNKFIRVKGVRWYTNLQHKKRNELIDTIYTYKKHKDKYPKYDNYDAINVDKVIEIPMDYEGVMGVPITFLDKHNPKQFEILGLDDHRVNWRGRGPDLNGKTLYRRLIIRKIQKPQEKEKL